MSCALAVRGMDDLFALAGAVKAAGLCGVKTQEEAVVRMLTGMELGLTPMQSLRGVYLIEGRPVLSADLMVAVAKSRRDVCEYFRVVASDARVATYETKRVSEPEPQRLSYSIEQAQRAGLASRSTWKAHPEAMLRARCASALARMMYPDLLSGIYDGDEAQDMVANEVLPSLDELLLEVSRVTTPDGLKPLWRAQVRARNALPSAEQDRLTEAFKARKDELQ